MSDKVINVGLIGAGYIAGWHAEALKLVPGARLAAVCDLSASAAEGLAGAHGARAFSSVEDLIASGAVEAVHILTPPDSHAALARKCLAAGLHVLIEKPVALSGDETAGIASVARAAGRYFAAGHNFLGLPSYLRLKDQIARGELGRISSAEITWALPLAPLRSGPYGLWLLREPRNLLLELGPHLFAFAHDLFGPVTVTGVYLSKPVALPGAGTRPQSWRITAEAGGVDLAFNLQLVETVDDRSLILRGSSGLARLDYAADVLTVAHENTADLVLNPFLRQMGAAWGHLCDGAGNAARQVGSLNRKSPYALGFVGSFEAFYTAIRTGEPLDARFDGVAAEAVMRAIDAAIALMPDQGRETWAAPKARRKPKPTALVIGGTGFLGRDLTRALVARGQDVRVLSRGAHGPFDDLPESVETCAVSLRDEAGLSRAMEGVEVVYNLARALGTSWEECLENDVAVSDRIARAALAAGVGRFVYTGTIASYDMSNPQTVITESTPFAPDMRDRNLYARSKAECERRLWEMAREHGLPLTIARPGIVVGHGGPLQHWGIGRWHGAGAVRLWGSGDNPLPFVLIGDVSDALIRMGESRAAPGQSFNLVGDVPLSARSYFNAIHMRLGARIRVSSGNLTAMWAADAVKSTLKTYALRRPGVIRASRRDWQSRAHFAPFDNAKPKALLGWQPVSNHEEFLQEAVDRAGLIGF
ncbi:NAD-dependent epimerase/dehydratase family protein [Roseovarius sp. 217]|uniref:NAD-dependent epimerase/dehydratase family protein n=1 Tax=Roseovarius sp. (strain 217) TaxID=314264 RepID=UPI0000684923|nr:NAD-dependent epimerase/dehydratase family protein [Roseovarius sp. 217]EAQ25692.1 oxidoreductase, Gfo/Idh/MocA family protein [Roseovarius sp. 217]